MTTALSLDVRPVHRTLLPGGDTTEHVLVRLRASESPGRLRPRLSAVLVLDVSGSMAGEPLEQVRDSARRLAQVLPDGDRLAVVAFSDGALTASQLRSLDAQTRAAIVRDIDAISSGGQTNMSGGLARAALELPVREAGERQLLLLMSDGRPNVGASTPAALADEVAQIKIRGIAVSALGFGPHHHDDVLVAIADAGGGRYAFVADPLLAAPVFARALGAQVDVVAEEVRLLLGPSDGVEIVRVLGELPTAYGAAGLRVTLSDAIAGDELNVVVELRVRTPQETGPWRSLKVALSYREAGSQSSEVVRGEAAVTLRRADEPELDEEAAAMVAIARADSLRREGRAHADRGNYDAARELLVQAQALVEAAPGFDAAKQGPLRDAFETLRDEIAVMSKKQLGAQEYQAWKRASRDYSDFASAGPRGRSMVKSIVADQLAGSMAGVAVPAAALVFLGGPRKDERIPITKPQIVLGRASDNDVPIEHPSISRRHACIVWNGQAFHAIDLKSTNAIEVNGHRVDRRELADGDVIRIGRVEIRFERPAGRD